MVSNIQTGPIHFNNTRYIMYVGYSKYIHFAMENKVLKNLLIQHGLLGWCNG